jgi:hypothetical protein
VYAPSSMPTSPEGKGEKNWSRMNWEGKGGGGVKLEGSGGGVETLSNC